MKVRNGASHSVMLIIIVVAMLQACVFVPVTKTVYDTDCQVTSKHMELEPVQVAAINHCNHDTCVAILAAASVTAVASAVISGSIMVVGNVVYWFEKQGQCKRAK